MIFDKFRVRESNSKIDPKRIPQNFVDAAADFERSKTEEAYKSRNLAWKVAGVFGVAFLLSAASASIAIFKRTEPQPTVITLEKGTGISKIERTVLDAADHFDEVTDKHWLSEYVKYRESYEWFEISTSYDIIKLMSSPAVFDEYSNSVYAKTAPLELLKDKGRLRVFDVTVSFVGSTAQVHFSVEKLNQSGVNTDDSPVKRYIATIAYQYENRPMTEQERMINNLGFTVVSYRIDEEVSK